MFKQINDNIIELLGINTFSVEKQKEVGSRILPLIYQEMLLRALELMTDTDKNDFEKFIENNRDPEIMFTYLSEKVPNIKEIAIEEANKIKNEKIYVDLVNK